MIIPFEKYHGLGNDFILLDDSILDRFSLEKLPELVCSICDRHCGIGADGLIVVKKDPLEMIYFNQDGSRADMCGNGLRCFTSYLFHHDQGKNFLVSTLAGPKKARVLDEKGERIEVELARPFFETEKLQVDTDILPWNYQLVIDDRIYPIWCLYMNTIHTVLYVEDLEKTDLEGIGHAICHHPLFKNQTNVNFVQIEDDHTFSARTYERGCGLTLACGTGMAACAVVNFLEKGMAADQTARLEKGNLEISLDKDLNVTLKGAARRVATGEYEYEY